MKNRMGMAIVPLIDILLVLLALMMLMTTVPTQKETESRGALPAIEGERPPPGVEVALDDQGNLTQAAAKWALPKPGEEPVLYCQQAGVWRQPVVRLRAPAAAPHGAVMRVIAFLQGCQIQEIAVLGASLK